MIWEKTELNPEELRAVARRYQLDLISAAVLIRRDYLDEDSIRFILDNDPLLMHNPFLFKDMSKALRRIHGAVSGGQLIQIFGDHLDDPAAGGAGQDRGEAPLADTGGGG
jgi:single-stranded-DNA-specific exonuclease